MTFPLTFTPTHLTYRLRGSLHTSQLTLLERTLASKKALLHRAFPAEHRKQDKAYNFRFVQELEELNTEYYVAYDRLLDQVRTGPTFLAGTPEKKIVINSWQHIVSQYELRLYAISVMSNHVHVVIGAKERNVSVDTPTIMRHHKHYTAGRLNKQHGKSGRRVWAKGVYDRYVRPGLFGRVVWYVLNNPTKAGLTDRPLEWVGNWFDPVIYDQVILPRVQKAG